MKLRDKKAGEDYKYEFTYTSEGGKLIAYNNADRDSIYRMSLFGDMTVRALVDEGFYIVYGKSGGKE